MTPLMTYFCWVQVLTVPDKNSVTPFVCDWYMPNKQIGKLYFLLFYVPLLHNFQDTFFQCCIFEISWQFTASAKTQDNFCNYVTTTVSFTNELNVTLKTFIPLVAKHLHLCVCVCVCRESDGGREYTDDTLLSLFSETYSKVITVFMDENSWTYQRKGRGQCVQNINWKNWKWNITRSRAVDDNIKMDV